jgi:multiphosphoryl transfer protein
MVGLVIVSHSRALAEALANLVRQITSQDLPLAVTGGVGPDRQEFGTDAVEIMEAIQSVDGPDGVLVLMDLGSAVLSAEMALEFLDPEIVERVTLCAAPLVEGAIAAGVQAGLGMDRAAICQEASMALLPKTDHLGVSEQPPSPLAELSSAPQPGAERVVLTLHNLHGLHARPAARFVQTAASFSADIQIRNLSTGKGPVTAKSLNALVTLGALQNHQVEISASGPEAAQALQALGSMVEANFGEPTEAPQVQPERPKPAAAVAGSQPAVPVSDGIALGPFFRFQPPLPEVVPGPTDQPEQDWGHLQQALETTRLIIRQRQGQLAQTLGPAETAIFDAHLLILQDPDLLEQVKQAILVGHENAASAWQTSIRSVAATYQGLNDPYLQQRAVDVLDVGNQVLFALAGKPVGAAIQLPHPVVLFAEDLTPTETAQLDMDQVLGVITTGGGPTSHSAILARSLGIPAVSGANPFIERVKDSTLVGLDGSRGAIWIDPAQDVQADLEQRRTAWLDERQRLQKTSHALAATRDGQRVEVVANVGNTQDARAGLQNGAEGIGLLRTEFLYLTRTTAPEEDEQYQSLKQIGEALAEDGNRSRPIIVRTMDIGGDKALPYLPMPAEANPFLGVRALRLSLRNPEIFVTQLKAILRAGSGLNFRIMFPMVADLEEVRQAKQWLEKAHQALAAENKPHTWPIETGIMVEIPSAALISQALAPEVDFFSIGTNDLTQYTLAAERGNPALSGMADGLHPAVLRLIKQVADSAHQYGKWTGVCGELAGDALAAPVLVGLGVDELSMNPGGIPRAKAILRQIDLKDAQALAAKALELADATQVRQLARQFAQEKLPELV